MVTNPGSSPEWATARQHGHTRVLWLSRHEITEKERTALTDALGPCVIQRHDAPIHHPEELHTLMAVYDPDRVVSVLPMVLQESLVNIAFMRQMEPVIRPRWHHRQDGDISQVTALTFNGFDEILELVFKKRRLIKENDNGDIFEFDSRNQESKDN